MPHADAASNDPSPHQPIRRFDVFAEYTRQARRENEKPQRAESFELKARAVMMQSHGRYGAVGGFRFPPEPKESHSLRNGGITHDGPIARSAAWQSGGTAHALEGGRGRGRRGGPGAPRRPGPGGPRLRPGRAAGALSRTRTSSRSPRPSTSTGSGQLGHPAPVDRRAVAGGAGLERRGPLPALERHPQQHPAAAGWRTTATSASSATRRATATATPSTGRAARSPASTATAGSCATSTTAR